MRVISNSDWMNNGPKKLAQNWSAGLENPAILNHNLFDGNYF
jgi:hypothetical protein